MNLITEYTLVDNSLLPENICFVTLSEIKAHCRIAHDDDDALLNTYHNVAAQQIENYISRPVLTKIYDVRVSSKSDEPFIFDKIPLVQGPYVYRPLSLIVKEPDKDEETISWGDASDRFEFRYTSNFLDGIIVNKKPIDVEYVKFNISAGKFCSTDDDQGIRPSNSYDAWNRTRAFVPLKAAGLLIIGGLYENRESVVSFNVSNNPTLKSLLNPYRRY